MSEPQISRGLPIKHKISSLDSIGNLDDLLLFEPLTEKWLSCNWEEKMQKVFLKDRSKKKSESFFMAPLNDETKTGLAIVALENTMI